MIKMLKQNEMQILEVLFDNLNEKYTINSLSKKLKQDYAQTYRIISELQKRNLIQLEQIGSSKQLSLDWKVFHEEFISVEIYRSSKVDNLISKIISKLVLLEENVCIILFGSYASSTHKKSSDVDLLIITENEKVKLKIKNQLALYNCDYNFAKYDEILDMWSSSKLNVGNEILKNHRVLIGYDYFIRILFQRYNK